jgi:hypothetical protein
MSAGMLPVAMGWAGDPSFRAPMGVAVLGGLIVSTVVSLFIVPVFYTLVEDMQSSLARSFGRLRKKVAVPAARLPDSPASLK